MLSERNHSSIRIDGYGDDDPIKPKSAESVDVQFSGHCAQSKSIRSIRLAYQSPLRSKSRVSRDLLPKTFGERQVARHKPQGANSGKSKLTSEANSLLVSSFSSILSLPSMKTPR